MLAKKQTNNQGYVLLLVVVIVAGLGAATPAVLQLGNSELLISRNYCRQIENYYLRQGVVNKAQVKGRKELRKQLSELAKPLQRTIIAGSRFSDCRFDFESVRGQKVVAVSEVRQVVVEDSKLNINFASAAELKSLPGIGSELSDRIVANRRYSKLQQLKAVKGIGKVRYNQVTGLVTVIGDKQVNVNTAPVGVLTTFTGIGPILAGRIIAGRPFKQLSELKEVKGIGPATVKDLRSKLKFTAEYFQLQFKVEIPARDFTARRRRIIKLQ